MVEYLRAINKKSMKVLLLFLSITLLRSVYGEHETCRICTEEEFCFDGVNYQCPLHSRAALGSNSLDDCKCIVGYEKVNNACVECEAGFYCSGQDGKIQCQDNSDSQQGSGEAEECFCLAGYVKDETGTCTLCPKGTFSNEADPSCSNCPANTFSITEGLTQQSDCTSCPSNTVSPSGSVSVSACVADKGHYTQEGTVIACEAGYYQDEIGQTSCKFCSTSFSKAEFYSLPGSTSSTSCLACPSDSFIFNGNFDKASECQCDAGYTGTILNEASSCAECDTGTYKNAHGSAACTNCPAGTYSTGTAQTSLGTCVACPDNEFSEAGSQEQANCFCNAGYEREETTCVACQAGYYKDLATTDNLPCVQCASGKYSIDKINCDTCPSFSETQVPSESADDCVCLPGYEFLTSQCEPCGPGQFNDNYDAQCSDCAIGSYSSGEAATSCDACPLNSHNTQTGNNDISSCKCNAGYESVNDVCTQCEAGKFKSSWGGHVCSNCPLSTYSDSTGATICSNCPANSYASNGSLSINNCKCQPGYAAVFEPDGTTLHSCAACNAGFFKATTQNSACTACPKGTSQSSGGQAACDACEENLYQDSTGQTICLSCPTHSLSDSGSDSIADCKCQVGFYYDANKCHECANGFYKDTVSNDECVACVSGFFTTSTASTTPEDCLECAENRYISAEAVCEACPANSESPAASDNVNDCKCVPGFTGYGRIGCTACQPGKFKATVGSASCTECGDGSVFNSSHTGLLASESKACMECAPNTYKQTLTYCENCPANSQSPSGSTAINDCLCNAGYTGTISTVDSCLACDVGTYKSSVGSSACTQCPAGKFGSLPAQLFESSCTACPANTTQDTSVDAELSSCICKQGYTGPDGGPCVLCEPGSFKDAYGSAACAVCPENTFYPSKYNAPFVQNLCLTCNENMQSVAGSFGNDKCLCGPGHYRTGMTCQLCAAGSYCPTSDAIFTCPAHMNSAVGSISVQNCSCVAGYFQTIQGVTPCIPCPVDSFCTSPVENQACPPDSSTQGKTMQQSISGCKCNAGFYRTVDDTCVQCPPGSFCHGLTQKNCPPNSHSAAASTSLDECHCDEGYAKVDTAFNFSCTKCSHDYVCYGGEASVLACATNALTTDNSECLCRPGYYCDSGLSGVTCDVRRLPDMNLFSGDNSIEEAQARSRPLCTICPADSYCFENKKTSCSINEISVPGSHAQEQCKCKKGTQRNTAGDCVPCMAGVFCAPSFKVLPISRSSIQHLSLSMHDTIIADSQNFSCSVFDDHLTTSFDMSTSALDCVCQDGFFRINHTDRCKPCPLNHYCPPECPLSKINTTEDTTEDTTDDACATKMPLPNIISCGSGRSTVSTKSTQRVQCTCPAGFLITSSDAGIVSCSECANNQLCGVGTHSPEACDYGMLPNANHTECVCPPGTAFQLSACAPCPSGHINPSQLDECQACPMNFYANDTFECLPCPKNSQTFQEASVYSDCYCVPPKHFDVQTQTCEACPPNTYYENFACVSCPAHASSSGNTSTQLTDCVCAAGRLLNVTSAKCEKCPADTLQVGESCVSCGAHAHSPPGSFEQDHCVCEACKSKIWNNDCVGECASATTNCSACEPGKFKASYSGPGNADICLECEQGKYQNYFSEIECWQCPEHSYHTLTGQASVDSCLCNAGYHLDAVSDVCVACEPGKFKASLADETSCTFCTVHTFADTPASTACLSCVNHSTHTDADKTVDIGSSDPLQCVCEPGKQLINTTCVDCPVGSYKSTIGNDACHLCGRYMPNLYHHYGTGSIGAVSSDSCQECPLHSGQDPAVISFNNLMNEITDCLCFAAHDSFDAENGCTVCDDYKFKVGYSNEDCRYCDDGFFFVDKNIECTQCSLLDATNVEKRHIGFARNSYDVDAFAWGTSFADCMCELGYYRSDDTCYQCAIGTVRNFRTQVGCIDCPADFYGFGDNRTHCRACPAHSTTKGAIGSDSVHDCICDAGYTKNDAGDECVPCRAGTFRAEEASNTLCVSCLNGFYSYAGASSCSSCGINEQSAFEAPSVDYCHCKPGFGATVDLAVQTLTLAFGDYGTLYNFQRGTLVQVISPASHPFAITDLQSSNVRPLPALSFFDPATAIVIDASTQTATTTFTIPNDYTADLYYYCTNHGSMGPYALTHAPTETTCSACAEGKFSEGGTVITLRYPECQACPQNKSSPIQSDHISDCLCVPGHGVHPAASANQPCNVCQTGFYAPGNENELCKHCGWGAVTEPEYAAVEFDQCLCDATIGVRDFPGEVIVHYALGI